MYLKSPRQKHHNHPTLQSYLICPSPKKLHVFLPPNKSAHDFPSSHHRPACHPTAITPKSPNATTKIYRTSQTQSITTCRLWCGWFQGAGWLVVICWGYLGWMICRASGIFGQKECHHLIHKWAKHMQCHVRRNVTKSVRDSPHQAMLMKGLKAQVRA